MNELYPLKNLKNITSLKIVQNVDCYLTKKSKLYFLFKKMKDYGNRLHNQGNWSIRTIKKYDRKWKYLNQKYNQINVYGIEFVGIGETVPRLFMYLQDKPKRDKNIYHIVLPTFFPDYTSGIVNNKIFDVFERYIHFITNDNFGFWLYVIIMHSNKMNTEHFDIYAHRDACRKFNIEVGKAIIPFSSKVKAYAKEKMQIMGVTGGYICLHAREAATKTINFTSAYADTSAVDADINTYGKACAYMQRLGYQAVRMGKDESKECEIESVIDYANNFYDELMDFYLIANCRFFIGCSSGITAITAYWGRPVLLTNALSFCRAQESLPWTEYDLYIPKKFYSKHENRPLNLYEMLDISYKCDRYNARLAKEGIELVNNTAEEILEATIEMNEKLSHTWTRSEEEIYHMEKYWKIISLWKSRHKLAYVSRSDGNKGVEMIPRPIAYSYLKDNLYLLDVRELPV